MNFSERTERVAAGLYAGRTNLHFSWDDLPPGSELKRKYRREARELVRFLEAEGAPITEGRSPRVGGGG